MSKIKILSGWSNPGGSTCSLLELTELFNERGHDCTFWGPHDWHLDKSKYSRKLEEATFETEDRVICHFLTMPERPPIKKIILSCHEKTVFPIQELGGRLNGFDKIRFLSEEQKEWHKSRGVVIPNTIRGIQKVENPPEGVAAVIGTVSSGKGTHLSIKRALEDGCSRVVVFGNCLDKEYFETEIKPLLLPGKVDYMGMEMDRQRIYDMVSKVYQTNTEDLPEAWGRVKAECMVAGVEFCGNEHNDNKIKLWGEDAIYDAWKELLEL